jgi:hypothetical protein
MHGRRRVHCYEVVESLNLDFRMQTKLTNEISIQCSQDGAIGPVALPKGNADASIPWHPPRWGAAPPISIEKHEDVA